MSVYNENVELIVDNFDYTAQGSKTSAFSHSIKFKNSAAINRDNQLKPNTLFSGASVKKRAGELELSSGSEYPQYTNYENIELHSTPLNLASTPSRIDSFGVKLYDFGVGDRNVVSYDLFETINPSYNQSEVEVGISLGTTKISIVLMNAPASKKLNNPTLFNQSIHDEDSFWSYRGGVNSEVCITNRIKDSERILAFRIRKNGNIVDRFGSLVRDYTKVTNSYRFRSTPSGNIKAATLTEIGPDGRYANYSDIKKYIIDANLASSVTPKQIIDNISYYPDRNKSTVIDTASINVGNKLGATFDVKVDSTRKVVTVKAIVFSTKGDISYFSDTLTFPLSALTSLQMFQRLSSKNTSTDYILSNMTYSSSELKVIEDPKINGKYEQPIIALEVNGAAIDISNSIELLATDTLSIYAYSPYINLDSNIKTAYNGSTYTTANRVNITGIDLFKTHILSAYVAATIGVDASEVSELAVKVVAKVPDPTISFELNPLKRLEVSMASQYDIFYSTDGTEPDLVNYTNCALYTGHFICHRSLIIKAVAVYLDSKSDIVSLYIDPQALYPTRCNTPTITVSGTKNSDNEYTSLVNVNLSVVSNTSSEFDGPVDIRYTLDGSDPANEANHESKIYIDSFDVRPLGGRSITIKAVAVNGTMKNSNIASTELKFAYECNAWRIDNTFPAITAATLTSEGALKIFNGTELVRTRKFQTDVEMNFDIVDVKGAIEILFGYHSYLKNYNNYRNQIGYESSRNVIPSISIYDVSNGVATLSLGYKTNRISDNNYNAFGSFDFNLTSKPRVKLTLKSNFNIPDGFKYLNAISDMSTSILDSSIELNLMKGFYNEGNHSCIVYNIPSDEHRVIKLNDTAVEGTVIEITRRGVSKNSILHISSTIGFGDAASISIVDSKALIVVKGSTHWTYSYVDSYYKYNGTSTAKLEVGKLSSNEMTISDTDADYLMMIVSSVNNNPEDYLTISNITGNCV